MARPDPRAEPESLPPLEPPPAESQTVAKADAVAISSVTASPKPTPTITPDPRVAQIEPLVARNDWKLVAGVLGPIEDAEKLPPNLGLVAAVAHNELAPEGNADARKVANRSMAALLGMAPDSEVVQVVTGRLLRKNPIAFRKRPAPPAKTSMLIVFAVLMLGSAAGWFLASPMFWRLVHR
jgi:hypothetical protein